MAGPARIARGLLSDAACPVSFRFDGRALSGLAGDTLAAALLANGVRVVGRSFKYHRPRGIVTAGPEEPCALVDVIGPQGREPNHLATTLPLSEGLVSESQNRWPSLRRDVLAVNDLASRFLPAGFYYKTFMAPGWAWERLYEPLIRRAAGLGRLEPVVGPHPDPAETVHDHADVLVVGAGAAGLAAASQLGACGLRVILAEQDVVLGGGTLLDPLWNDWRERVCARLAALSTVRCLAGATVVGAYGHGVFGVLQTLDASERSRFNGLRSRLRVVRAQRVVIATGAIERLIAFSGNDVPGVMLAGAALAYLRRYGIAVGRHPAFFVNNDAAYEAVFALAAAGVRCAGVIDPRSHSRAAERAKALGIAIGSGYLFETTFRKEVFSDLTGERGVLMGAIYGLWLAQYEVLREHGHSPSEAFNETVEEATQSLYPLIAENGMDWMYANCSTTAQRGAIDWYPAFRDAVKPLFHKLYESVATGEETRRTLEANSRRDYRAQLEKELKQIADSEMWRAGKVVRQLRPEMQGK
jgi:NADPH-dependent 2,4-dienoyl-CoA reductase/sulfur reductase-like enzyme